MAFILASGWTFVYGVVTWIDFVLYGVLILSDIPCLSFTIQQTRLRLSRGSLRF